MPRETVLDRFVTILGFATDTKGLKKFETQMKGVEKRLDSVANRSRSLAVPAGIVGGVIAGAAGLAVKAAIGWESAFTDVRKTVDGTEAELLALEKTLRSMAANDIPISVTGLAAIAANAGQLGILTPNIVAFTEVMAKLGVTTNLSAEQAATQLSRLGNITGLSQDDYDRLGSTIVWLGNNFATTEAEISTMSLRLAGAGTLIGLTEAQILGFAAGLSSVGIEAEAGGTAFSRVFADMQAAVQTNSKELDTFSQVSGMTKRDFAALFESDPATAVLEFVRGLNRAKDAGKSVHPILESLGFDNVRIRDSLLRAAGSEDKFTEAVEGGTRAWEDNTALTREAELRFGTFGSQLQITMNKVTELSYRVGETLAPALQEANAKLGPLLTGLADFIERHPTLIKAVGIFGLALLGLSGILFGVAIAAKTVAILLSGLQVVTAAAAAVTNLFTGSLLATRIGLGLLAVQTGIATAGLWALNIAMYANPVVLIVLGILALVAALAVAGYFIWKFRDQIVGGVQEALHWLRELPLPFKILLAVLGGPIAAIALLIAHFGDLRDAGQKVWDFVSGQNWFEQGRRLFTTFTDGIKDAVGGVVDAVTGGLSKARDLLPFSDAREGPLSDLTGSGRSLVTTFARGINAERAMLSGTLRSVLDRRVAGAAGRAGFPAGRGRGRGRRGQGTSDRGEHRAHRGRCRGGVGQGGR